MLSIPSFKQFEKNAEKRIQIKPIRYRETNIFYHKKSSFSALKIVPFSESAFKLLAMLNRTLFLILLTLAVNF